MRNEGGAFVSSLGMLLHPKHPEAVPSIILGSWRGGASPSPRVVPVRVRVCLRQFQFSKDSNQIGTRRSQTKYAAESPYGADAAIRA